MTKKIHGLSRTKSYRAWLRAMHRCYNPRDKEFKNYGGRGIRVCQEWQGPVGFLQFLDDMGPPPSPESSLERTWNDGPYTRSNCRWASRKEQARNRRTCRILAYAGRTQTLTEWSEQQGLSVKTLWTRLHRGWSLEEALTRRAA